ncbi:MAG TPA: SagB family peptide dehydrogenase [Candidatus Acidoferrum sp.]|nr:SagB family peptide dehydrogenase [Candidatus Acidoferrum sp.]
MSEPGRQARVRGAFFRRAPFLVSYWQGKQLYFENYLTRKKIAASMETAALLDFFDGWKRDEVVFRRWPEYTRKSLRNAIRRLVEESFLQKSARRNPREEPREKALREWKAWNPAAGFFHMQTKDTYSEEINADEIRGAGELLGSGRAPFPRKSYFGSRTIALPRNECSGEFPRVLRERRTWRKFGGRPIPKEIVARLLHLSFGIQRWLRIPEGGRFAQKTSPSGGALHPAEAYLHVQKVRGIPRGIYHYDAVGHQLQKIRRGASPAEIQKMLAGQWWFREAAIVVFLTAIFHRTQWKYDYPRAYRAVLAEAGHLCQTFCLTATWLGLAPFCTMAFADTRIEKALKVDGVSESVLYIMGAGTKPAKK